MYPGSTSRGTDLCNVNLFHEPDKIYKFSRDCMQMSTDFGVQTVIRCPTT
jgi:hypothetical protein